MSNTVRTVWLTAGLVALSGGAFAARPVAPGTMPNPLRIGMLADSVGNRAFLGTVEFKVTNSSRETMKIPAWQLPSGSLQQDLFVVHYNGKPVRYTGPMIKRAAPVDADYIVLRPGESRLVTVDLSTAYDLSRPGEYTVKFRSYLQGARSENGRMVANRNGGLAKVESAPLRLWVDAANPLQQLKSGGGRVTLQGKPGGTATVVNGVSFVGCSSTQINGAGQAVVDARTYTENSKGSLAGSTVGPRYTTWFGAYTSTRWGTAKSHFTSIDSAMDQNGGQVKINCGCNQNYYAYVYPTKHYEIFVCKAFWTAPATGTDSKAGTLVHEMSHFNVTAATDDVVYGQSGAKSLAISNPDQALNNADSHEYFAENTPSQN
ncbi:MAG: M35 family metallo-endopeptidase [Arenimonas sp.]